MQLCGRWLESWSGFWRSASWSLCQIKSAGLAWALWWPVVTALHWMQGGLVANTNRKFTTRFPMSLRWSSYVAPKPPKGAQTQSDRFRSKLTLCLKKVYYKVSLCENCQRQSCKAFIGLSIRAKMIGAGADPFYLKFWLKLTPLERKRRFSIYWITLFIINLVVMNTKINKQT